MAGVPYYAQAFSPLPGRCFRMVARHGLRRVARTWRQASGTPVGCRNPVMQLVGDTHGAGRRAGLAGPHGADLV
jgi:hypothetical protein